MNRDFTPALNCLVEGKKVRATCGNGAKRQPFLTFPRVCPEPVFANHPLSSSNRETTRSSFSFASQATEMVVGIRAS